MGLITLFLSLLLTQVNLVVVERAFFVMGTILEFELHCENKKSCNDAVFEAYSEVKRLDDMLSNYKPDSDLSKLNSVAGKRAVVVPEEFFDITRRSIYFSRITNGAFDITVGRLVRLWKESESKNVIPDENTLKKTVSECVGFDKIMLYPRERKVFLNSSCLSIDFGGIGKGYAVDRVVEILRERGIRRGIVNFGGNIYAMGSPVGKSAWRIGIRDPWSKDKVIGYIEISDMAVSTSGDYERFFEIKGRRFSHIIDPRSGFPVSGVHSVTVLAKSATEVDALSTAISVMGIEKGVEFVDKLSSVGVMMIAGDSKSPFVYRNDAFKKFEVNHTLNNP